MTDPNASKPPSLISDLIYLGVIAFNLWLLIERPSPRPSGTAIRIGVIAFCAVGLLLSRVARRAPTPAGAAAEIMRQQKAVYGGLHEFARVGPEAFDGLDLEYYDNAGSFLYTQGYGYLADVQNKTLQQSFRWAHTVIRMFLGDGGVVSAGVYHVRLSGWPRALQWVGLLARRMKCVDLETELSDGSFVVTANARGVDTTGEFPGIDRHSMPPLTPLHELLAAHRDRVAAAVAVRPGVRAIVMRGYDDVIAMQHRLQAVKNAHKQKIGYLNAEELANITGRTDQATMNLAREIEAIKDAEGLGDDAGRPPGPPPLPPPALPIVPPPPLRRDG